MPARGLWPGITTLPCLRGQQFPEAFAPAYEIFWQRIVGKETADLVLGGVDTDPPSLLNGTPTLNAGCGCGRIVPGVVDFLEQSGDVCIPRGLGPVMRFGMFAEDRNPVSASTKIMTDPVDSPPFVLPAELAGRFDGFEVGHLISMAPVSARAWRFSIFL